MSPRLGDRELTPEELDRTLEVLIEQAFQSSDWRLVVRALQVGIDDEDTRVASCCRLGGIIMRRLFVLKENDEQVQSFLVDELRLDPEKALVFVLMSIESAKKAVDVVQNKKSLDAVVEELRTERDAESELARPMIETGVEFLERWSPRGGFAALAIIALFCHPVIAFGICFVVWLSLFLAFRFEWWSASLISIGLFFLMRLIGVIASLKLNLMLAKQRGGQPAEETPH